MVPQDCKKPISHLPPLENEKFKHFSCFFFFAFLQNDPVIPAFPDLHLSPAAIMKELSMYFQKFTAQTRLLSLPSPHELPAREAQEYPLFVYLFLSG